MSWVRAYNGVRDKLITDKLDTRTLEVLARGIPINEPDEHRATVGAAIGSVLVDRYRGTFRFMTDAEVFDAGHRHPGDTFRDRVDRARSDACYRVLEERHPGEPFDTYPYADDVQNAPEGSWRAHVRAFYGLEHSPEDLPCDACNAEPGEPCRPGCLGHALATGQLEEAPSNHD